MGEHPSAAKTVCLPVRRSSHTRTVEEGGMSIMVRDALLHFAHFLCIFLLASLLAAETFLLSKSLSRERVLQLQGIDRWYGISAGLVIVSGIALAFLGAKGASYYGHNPIFWIKMVLFLIVALLSIVPTVAFLRWNKRESSDGTIVLEDGEYRRLRAFIWVQIGVFVFIPLCAALMANGISP
jgi:putative membrane protein